MAKSMMKMLLAPLGLVVIAACIFIYVTHYPPIPPANHNPPVSSALAMVMSVVELGYPLVGSVLIVGIISNALSLPKSVGNLRQLEAGHQGQPPEDGSVIAVAGQIVADHSPVITPVSQTSCIAYYYYVRKGFNTGIDYFGYALTPSSIAASSGKVAILAVPQIDFFSKPGTKYDDSSALNNFKSYFDSNEFAESLVGWAPLSKERDMPMADRMRPVKGDVDMKRRHSNSDLDGCDIIERCLDEGESVCAFGLYSASQQGLVYNPESGHPLSIQIKMGPITKFIKEQKSSIMRSLLGTVFMLAMLTAMVWAYQNFYYIYETLYNFGQFGK